jgi:mRNA interferase MazF
LDKTRPVVVMHRDFAGRFLGSVLVTPLTTTIRDIPTEVRLGRADGIDRDCAASLDNLTLLTKDRLERRLAQLDASRMDDLYAALGIALGCQWSRAT